MLFKFIYLYLILMAFTPSISGGQPRRCFYKKKTGLDKYCTSRWYYNWKRNICIKFAYCGTDFPNGNNFVSRERCIRSCKI